MLLSLSSQIKRSEQGTWGRKLGRLTFAKGLSSSVFQPRLAVLIGIVHLFCWVVGVCVTKQWSQISWKIK